MLIKSAKTILLSALFLSPVWSYEQVEVHDVIPLGIKKIAPTHLKVDPIGNFWVLNANKNLLQQITEDGKALITLSGGKGKKALFKRVADFSFRKKGAMVVADMGLGRIVVLDPQTEKILNTFPSPNPAAVALSEDDVVAVANNKDQVIHIYSIDGVLLHNLFAPGKAPFKEIVSLGFAKNGILYALDRGTDLLHRFRPNRKWLGAISGMKAVGHLDLDDYGYAYVSSLKGRWYEINPKGRITGTFGTKGKKKGQMHKPSGLVIRHNKTVWVSELGTRRLQGFDVSNKDKVELLPFDPTARVQVRSVAQWPSLVTRALFNPKGEILLYQQKKRKFEWIDEEGNTLQKFGRKGKREKGFSNPMGFDLDPDGLLWVSDGGDHHLKQVSKEGQIMNVIFKKGRKEGNIKNPSHIRIRDDGSIVLADKNNTRVQVFSKDGMFLFRVGSRGEEKGRYEEVTGLAINKDKIAILDNERKAVIFYDSTGKFHSEVANQEDKPPVWMDLVGIETDENGRFYIMDRIGKRVRIFTAKGRFLSDVSVYGNNIVVGPNGKFMVLNPKSVSIYAADFVPKRLRNLKAIDEEGIVKVKWDSCLTCVEYKVYRSSESHPYQLLTATTAVSIFDEDVLPGVPYTYLVRGVNQSGYQGNRTVSKPLKPSRRKDISLVSVSNIKFNPVFTASFKYYVNEPIGTIEIQNNDDRPYRNIKLSLSLRNYTDFATEKMIKRLAAGEKRTVPVTMTFNASVLELTENTPVQADVKLSYFQDNEEKSVSQNAPLMLYSRNAIVWTDRARIASFVTPRDVPVMEFSRAAIKAFLPQLKASTVGKPLAKAALLYESMNGLKISYVPDPKTPYAEAAGNPEILDYVQFPRETLRRRTGDCDDTTALLASLLESIGVEVAMVETPGHILLMANLEENDPNVIGIPEERFVEYRGTLWVPIETTKLGSGFLDAWQEAITTIRSAEEQGKLGIIPLIEATEKYAPVTLVEKPKEETKFPESEMKEPFMDVMKKLQEEKYDAIVKRIKNQIKENPENNMLYIRLGMAHVEGGKISEGKKIFSSLLKDKQADVQAAAYNNLGNLAYLNQDFKSAVQHYADAAILSPDDGGILINRARAAWKLGRRKEAKKYLIEAKELLTDWKAYATDIPTDLWPKI